MTRDEIMQEFRNMKGNSAFEALTPEDRIEIFTSILLGSSDLTNELIRKVALEYEGGELTVKDIDGVVCYVIPCEKTPTKQKEFVALSISRHDLEAFIDDPSKISDSDMQTIADEIGANLSGNDDLSNVIEDAVDQYKNDEASEEV